MPRKKPIRRNRQYRFPKNTLDFAMRLVEAGLGGRQVRDAMLAARVPTYVVERVLGRIEVPPYPRQINVDDKIKSLVGDKIHSEMVSWVEQGLPTSQILVCLKGYGLELPVKTVEHFVARRPVTPEAREKRREIVLRLSRELIARRTAARHAEESSRRSLKTPSAP
jgi:hypothetical protein